MRAFVHYCGQEAHESENDRHRGDYDESQVPRRVERKAQRCYRREDAVDSFTEWLGSGQLQVADLPVLRQHKRSTVTQFDDSHL